MKNVLGLAVGQTYQTVEKYAVTAHPAMRPYPSNSYEYLVPIRKGGIMAQLFLVEEVIDCIPSEVYSLKGKLNDKHYQQLIDYHEERVSTYTYGKPNVPYRFYILAHHADIQQPFVRKYIQISIGLDINEIPLLK